MGVWKAIKQVRRISTPAHVMYVFFGQALPQERGGVRVGLVESELVPEVFQVCLIQSLTYECQEWYFDTLCLATGLVLTSILVSGVRGSWMFN